MPSLILVFAALLFPTPNHLDAQSPANSTSVSNEELSIYAIVLDTSPKLGSSSRPFIADSTSTFSCDKTSCNGFLMGSCNGMRSEGETISDRISYVKHDISVLQETTISSFIEQNKQCAKIDSKIPTASNYHMFNDKEIPNDWKYSYIVYFSRVGFNSDHTQALLYIGLVSATDPKNSKGAHFILTKISGKWVLGDSSSIWQMAPSE
ncbi:MAG: hypothetical protein WCF54_03210 [Terracidiphilus sp.]